MKRAIRQRALDLGFTECRFASASPPDHAAALHHWLANGQHGEMHYLARNADKRADPQLVLPGARTLICLAASYPAPPSSPPNTTPPCSGIIARYARNQDYHATLKIPLQQLTAALNQAGPPETRSLWYVDTGPILERDFAQRAGIGFIGKHTNLISRKAGNWILLAEIITTLDITPDSPEPNRCGRCVRCIDACPTNAITAPFTLDARKCISYLTIELQGPIPEPLRHKIGNRIFGCDDCLVACPWNRFARDSNLMSQSHRADLDSPDLIGLLNLDEPGFNRLFRGTPIQRVKRRGLLRNVCVALGNTGSTEHIPALAQAAQDPEPLIAEHAHWAIHAILHRITDPASATPRPLSKACCGSPPQPESPPLAPVSPPKHCGPMPDSAG